MTIVNEMIADNCCGGAVCQWSRVTAASWCWLMVNAAGEPDGHMGRPVGGPLFRPLEMPSEEEFVSKMNHSL